MKKLLSLTLFFILTLLLAACNNITGPNGEDPDTYTIDLSSAVVEATFTITPQSPVEAETEVTIEAHASGDHIFLHWVDETGNVISDANPYTFTPTRDVAWMAVFDSSEAETLAADEVEANFAGNLAHLNTLMETMNESNAQLMRLKILVEEDDWQNPGQTMIQTLIIEQHMVYEDNAITSKLAFDFDIDGEQMTFSMILRETENFMEVYLDIGMLLDELNEEEEDFDVREIFDIHTDVLFLSVPKDVFDDLETLLSHYFETLSEEMSEDQDINIDELLLEDMLTHLSIFEKYVGFDYYESLDDLDVTMNRLDSSHIETVLNLNGPMMAQFADDLLEDIHAYLTILDIEDLELPTLEDIRNMPEYDEAMSEMHDIEGSMALSVIYEPYHANQMVMHFDLFEFITLIDDVQEGLYGIDIEITREVATDITIPSETKNMAHIADELFQLMMFMDAYDLVQDIEYAWDPPGDGTYNLHELEAHYIYVNMVFYDYDLSTVVIDGDDITVDFYYAYNQAPIFKAPIDSDTLRYYGDMDVPTRTYLLEILDYMNQDNLNIYSLMLDTLESILEEISELPMEEPMP